MQALVAGDKFDRTRAQSLVAEKTAALNAKSPEVVAALGDFYDSLSPSQQQKVREFMAAPRRLAPGLIRGGGAGGQSTDAPHSLDRRRRATGRPRCHLLQALRVTCTPCTGAGAGLAARGRFRRRHPRRDAARHGRLRAVPRDPRESDIPIIMLTARGDVMDRIVGLELGADDYLPKPFEPRELVARMQTVLRRARAHAAVASGRLASMAWRSTRAPQPCGRASVGADRHRVRTAAPAGGEPGRVWSRDEILNELRGHEAELYTRAVDIVISRLRRSWSRWTPSRRCAMPATRWPSLP